MKILCTRDWHIRSKNPRYRIDDFFQTMMGKLNWMFELAKEENCDVILHGGDFFDSPDQKNSTKIEIAKLLLRYKVPVYVVAGQHDLLHRRFSNTTLALFQTFGGVNILDGELRAGTCIPCIDDSGHYDVNIYGASWEEEIPTPKDPDAINILAIHKMIVKDKPLWAEQKGYTKADTFLKAHKEYNLIVTGDNHQSFIHTTTNQILVNTGSLMRTTTAQREHTPVAVIYDSETRKAKKYLIPVKPIDEVMDLETANNIKEKNEALDAFMDGLSSECDIELKFEDNLKNLMDENETPDRVKKLGNSFLEKYYEGGK